MPNTKFYVVKIGRKPGIYKNWIECKKQIDGFSGAVFKSFYDYEEAEKFFWESNLVDELIDPLIDNNFICAYVDGSYSEEIHAYSYGCVIISDNQVIKTLSGNEDKEGYIEMRNVAGELLGAVNSIKWAIENGYGKIIIFHDYEGIARWASGDWKANKKGTKEYIDFISDSRKKIDITFKKVKGHSGDKYNDMADQLAKNSLFTQTKIDIEIDQDAEYKNLLMLCLEQENKTKSKIRISYRIGNLLITEKNIEMFTIKYMEKKGLKKDDIKYISVNLDSNCGILRVLIVDKKSNKDEFVIDLK